MKFSVLGPVVVAASEELVIGGAKRRALLARLLVDANRVVPAERLVEDLWDGDPPESALSTLQSHVYNLRQVLGDGRLHTKGNGYLLEVRDGELDAAAFERELAEASGVLAAGNTARATELFNQALGRWRGPAYADVAGASWVAPETSRLEEAKAVALESLLECYLAGGEEAEVVGRAEAAVTQYPFRERFWAQLMTALYRQGRQADALRAYQRVRALLAEELGIEPGTELRDLEQAVLVQSPELGRPRLTSPVPRVDVTTPPTLPSGVVTFFLTDVAGSTRLWDTNPTEMAQALARHDAIIRSAVDTFGGVLLKARGEGDSTFSVFARATDAVAGARAAQRGLAIEAWPPGIGLEVRMALHTGEALERDGDYYGPAVNRVARLRALADPGQILLSRSTTEVVFDHLPDDCRLVELGPRQLQDLARPETVYLLATDQTSPVKPVESSGERARLPLPVTLGRSPFAGFHGRAKERELLAEQLEIVIAGKRRLVLISGEPGIGKTSLTAEVSRSAFASGATVLYGRCDEDVAVPYRPWVEALGQLVEGIDDATLESLGNRRMQDLARLVPQIQDRMPGVQREIGGADPESERYLLFGAVVSLLQGAATRAPLVVVLDDLHWADKPSLSLLRHLVSSTEQLPLLVLGTYRQGELTPEHPLTDALAALRRESGVERLSLGGLGEQELVAMVESAAGQHLGQAERELVHAVNRETDGNPFFAWELILHLSESGAVSLSEGGQWLITGDRDEVSLPDSVRDVIGRRVARLGDDTTPILAAAAVIGREFDLQTVVGAVGIGEDGVLDALERAEAAGLVASLVRGRFLFSHALIPHTLYQDLKPTRRAQLHRRIAEAIERLDPYRERVTELARHWEAAADPAHVDKAIEYARLSGEQALHALAPDEAVRWYNQGVRLLAEAGLADDSKRCELLLGLGEAQLQIGDPAYRQTLLSAGRIAQQLGSSDHLVKAALMATRWGFTLAGQIDPERIEMLEAALKSIAPGDSAERALLLAMLANQLYFDSDHERRRAVSDEALAVARRVGDPVTFVQVAYYWCNANMVPETHAERRRLIAEAVAVGESLSDPIRLFWGLFGVILTDFEAGDCENGIRAIDRQQQLNEEIALPVIGYFAAENRISRHIHRGEFDQAEGPAVEMYELGLATGQPDALTMYGAAMLWIRWHQGRLAELVDLVNDAIDSSPDLPGFRAAADLALLEAGRASEIHLDRDAIENLPYDGAWAGGLTVWAEVATELRDREAAQLIFDKLSPYPSFVWFVHVLGTGAVAHYLGLLATLLERYDDAETYFTQALEIHTGLGDPFHIARTELGWGRLLLERHREGDVERGLDLLRQARQRGARYGCSGVVRTADALLASHTTRQQEL